MSASEVLIVGQGLAGSVLGWELERAGIGFEIVDRGHAGAASLVAAGIINPITGRRLVKSWRVDELLPIARDTYRGIGDALGLALWQPMRVRRLFADDRERATFGTKHAAGEFAGWVRDSDREGLWVEDAARVNLEALIGGLRTRWQAEGKLRDGAIEAAAETGRHKLVVDCTGVEAARGGGFDFVPWEFSKGEMIEVAAEGIEPGTILNRRHWLVPGGPGVAWVGATHQPGVADVQPSAAARATLEASARDLVGGPVVVRGQRVGVRVNLPDKLPVVGLHPHRRGLGLINGLGAKGALFAPFLAKEWVRYIQSGAGFTPAVDFARFADRSSLKA